VDGVATEYVLDVAGGLPEVIIATTGGASTYYVQVQGQILAQYGSGAWAYVLPDHLGSVRQLADADGQVTLAQSYDPFGVLLEANGSGASEFGYTGEWYGSYIDLLFLRARYYDPAVGRFLSEDTKPGIAYLPKSLHIYMYAWNNPVLLTDHSGLQPQPPECDDPTQICYTGTSGPQVTPSSPEVTTPPTTPEPSDGSGSSGSGQSTMTSLLDWCYTLPVEDREGCVGKVLELPPWKYPAGPVCPPPEQQVFLTSGIAGDPIGSAGMGERKYSYRKTSSQQVQLALFLGGADDPYDRFALVGGTYLSRLTAEIAVYENGILSKLYEEYDATNLAGLAVGVDISVARSVDVRLEGGFIYGPYLFGVVSAGESGISEQKKLWISSSRRSVLHNAVMHGAVSAENSLALPGGGYGWSYSLNLQP
jgi:RHS repeat-associated protein